MTRSTAPPTERSARDPRLGIFGGSFNPIHIAHLRCAEEVRESLQLDRVIFVPAGTPPHKPAGGIAPAEQRLAMVRRAVRGNPHFAVSPLEIERGGCSYSIHTVQEMRRRLPASRFIFLVGIDAFREIHTWKHFLDLFALADFAVLTRPPERIEDPMRTLPVAARKRFCYGAARSILEHDSGTRILFLQVTALDVSASDIRRRVGGGESIRYLVPPAVERYIGEHGLYVRRRARR